MRQSRGAGPGRAPANLLIAHGAWDAAYCREIRRAMDAGDAEAAEIVDAGVTVDEFVRKTLDITLSSEETQRLEVAVRDLWPRIEDFFGFGIQNSVGVTCLRYQQGGLYRRHRDRDPQRGSGTEMRRVSLIVWLSTAATTTDRGDFEGGAFRLYPDAAEAIELTPTAGTLLAFPSDWLHEVLPVTRGTRDAVVDWLY